MSSCQVCSLSITDENALHLQCAECEAKLHHTCAGLRESAFKNLSKTRKSNWKCPECKSKNNSPDDVAAIDVSSSESSILKIITEQHNSLKSFMCTKFDELTSSIEFNSDIIQDLKTQIDDLQKENKTLRIDQERITRENTEMKKNIEELKLEIVDLKQYTRRANFEISCLPETDNEDLIQVMTKIQEILEIDLVQDIVAIHRVPTYSKDKPKPIICQLKSKAVRDDFLKKARSLNLSAKSVNPRLLEVPIYFNEHLAPELKQLFFLARKYKQENHYKYCWSRDGKIFLRKDESSKIFRLKCIEDLNSIATQPN